ncbi:MAG: hypothetical protein OEU26_18525 [Candidatus Tectomicrobia bacterium]|nr:hypothetical protein [Candidatus Tectomicrobia bacterium]
MNNDLVLWFFREDGPVETLTFLCLLVSSGFMLYVHWRRRSQPDKKRAKWCYLLLGLLFLFGAMEEISWGQRIFHYQIEFVQKASSQNETNFHNLKMFQTLRNYGSWLKIIGHPDRIFTLFMLFLTTLIPILNATSKPVRNVLSRIQLPVTTWTVALSCVVSLIFPEMIDLVSESKWLHHLSQELQESMFALTLLFFSLHEYRRPIRLAMPNTPEPIEVTAEVSGL